MRDSLTGPLNRLVQSFTGADNLWALVETAGAEIDTRRQACTSDWVQFQRRFVADCFDELNGILGREPRCKRFGDTATGTALERVRQSLHQDRKSSWTIRAKLLFDAYTVYYNRAMKQAQENKAPVTA